jgi:hypothetical protein
MKYFNKLANKEKTLAQLLAEYKKKLSSMPLEITLEKYLAREKRLKSLIQKNREVGKLSKQELKMFQEELHKKLIEREFIKQKIQKERPS